MSCHRAHCRKFLACRYESPWLTGCCGSLTCSYTRQKRIDETESHQDREAAPIPGRKGLQYKHCQSLNYRPKFICPKPTCRKMVKPFYDPEMWDYRFNPWGGMSITPSKSKNPAYAKCWKEYLGRLGRRSHGAPTTERDKELDDVMLAFEDGGPHSKAELAQLREADPDAWTQETVALRGGGCHHRKRCPSCGDAVIRVGPTFEIPARKDDRAWRKVERMIEEGEDMVAKFSYCMTFEEHDKAILELQEAEDEGLIN